MGRGEGQLVDDERQSLTERLKRENEPESTLSAGKLFQRFITLSANKSDLTELL